MKIALNMHGGYYQEHSIYKYKYMKYKAKYLALKDAEYQLNISVGNNEKLNLKDIVFVCGK